MDYARYADEELIARLRGEQEENMPCGHTSMPFGNKEEIPCGHTSMPCGNKEEIPCGHTSMPFGNKEEITDYILDKYKPLVRKRANALYLIGGDTDDLIQEGMIGLFKAIRDYKKEEASSFYQFAQLCIERQMYTAVEASRRKKHAPLNSYVSLYDESGEEGLALADVLTGGADENPERLFIERESITQRLDLLSKNLSKMERQVFQYMLEGLNYRQIAEKMGKSPKAIDNAIQRMRAKA